MINVGLTSVADHPELATRGNRSTFSDYAQHFPVLELDTTFYGLKPVEQVRHWQAQVPSGFQFIKCHLMLRLLPSKFESLHWHQDDQRQHQSMP